MTIKRSIYAALGLGLVLGFAATLELAAAPAGNSPVFVVAQASSGNQEIAYKPLPKSGKKYEIGDGAYLIYEFSEKPKMGTVILKIQVFNKNGDRITPYLIKGRSDMPMMRGAHDSGDVEFKLNKKNDYLMPVNIVMPGSWEVRVTFLKDGNPLFYGSITFDV
jgi:hypothetical protein